MLYIYENKNKMAIASATARHSDNLRDPASGPGLTTVQNILCLLNRLVVELKLKFDHSDVVTISLL